jgi:hypothetical protein
LGPAKALDLRWYAFNDVQRLHAFCAWRKPFVVVLRYLEGSHVPGVYLGRQTAGNMSHTFLMTRTLVLAVILQIIWSVLQ